MRKISPDNPSTAKSQVEYNRASLERKKEAGIVRISTTVPIEYRQEILERCQALRDKKLKNGA